MANPFNPPLRVDEVSAAFPTYTRIDPFDSGGQGTIFRGQASDGTLVAIKIFFPTQMLRRAELEAQKLRQITSKYLVTLIDYGYSTIRGDQVFFSITRFEQGEDLHKKLGAVRQLPPEEVKKLVHDVSSAIDDLWQSRVVHCDINPRNILIGADGIYRLVDLGLAKHLDVTTITQYGTIMGTPGYMAPEQTVGRKNFTCRVDFYALGIVAYEALTGIHPFGRNQYLIMSGHMPQTPRILVPSVDQQFEQLLMSLLQPNVIFRPGSGDEIRRLL